MRLAAADDVVREALGSRFTAAVVRVEHGGKVLFERAYGALDDTEGAQPTLVTTRFDLASLTKPLVATAALMIVARGLLDLDSPLTEHLPEWKRLEQGSIALRHLLAHDSGMQSGADYRSLLGRDVERFTLMQPLANRVGERVIYSDLGFIALGILLARVTGHSLRAVVALSCAALDSQTADYLPRWHERQAIPATEDDDWRGRVRGFVHDEKAYLMGGVGGHAGIFGTALDVARMTELYLGAACGRAQPALPASFAREAIHQQADDVVLRRGLGWALKTGDENSCGALMSRSTFGHTGFTGTCVWADPERDLQIVFLSNAVYFGRRDLRDVRASLCDAVVSEIG